VTAQIDLYVTGGEQNPAWKVVADCSLPAHLISLPANQQLTATLSQIAGQAGNDWFTVVSQFEVSDVAALGQLFEQIEGQTDLQFAIAGSDDDEITAWIWDEFPPELASLIQPLPAQRPFLLKRTALDEFDGSQQTDEPLWDIAIRLAGDSPAAVKTFPCESPLSAKPQFPALAPDFPGSSRDWLRRQIRDRAPRGSALLSGLLQIHDYLDESHSVSQSMEGNRVGDHWHGIMHRREPDYGNAKYWYRRVGDSPLFPELASRAETVLSRIDDPAADSLKRRLQLPHDWDSFAFVDICSEFARDSESDLAHAVREIQFWEMLLLLQLSHQVMSV